jgi:hypothetical protein
MNIDVIISERVFETYKDELKMQWKIFSFIHSFIHQIYSETNIVSSSGSELLKCTAMYFFSGLESLHSWVHRDREMFNDEDHCLCYGDKISPNCRRIYSIADLELIIIDFASGLRQYLVI